MSVHLMTSHLLSLPSMTSHDLSLPSMTGCSPSCCYYFSPPSVSILKSAWMTYLRFLSCVSTYKFFRHPNSFLPPPSLLQPLLFHRHYSTTIITTPLSTTPHHTHHLKSTTTTTTPSTITPKHSRCKFPTHAVLN